jgi:peptide/nickel transport system substrate-binding protein
MIVFNSKFLTTIPARGGTIVEGVIGAPRLINPVLATTQTDRALTTLLFSGLTAIVADGTPTPDLAEHIETTADGLTYTFTLRDKLTWSDGKPLTATDVVFTYTKRALFEPNSYWQHVAISSPDPKTVIFTIPSPRSDFLTQTTLGIIPSHVWSNISDDAFESSEQNLEPVGSGPFSFVRSTERNGVVQEIYLKRNRHYSGTKPYLDRYTLLFFANQTDLKEALVAGSISLTTSATPEIASQFKNTYLIDTLPSTTTASLFQLKNAILLSPATLGVLNRAIDKQHIVDTIEYGYGILPDTAPASLEETRAALHSLGFTTRADGTLEKNGTPITFSVASENDPDTLLAAHALQESLRDIGITITIKAFDPGTFQDVIKHNEYQFFFAKMNRSDLPSSYDPAITLYTAAYPVIHKPKIHIPISLTPLSSTDQYQTSTQWYIRTNDVWKLFIN